MDPREKLLDILSKLNNQPIEYIDWKYHSAYAKQNIKRLASVLIEEVIEQHNQYYDTLGENVARTKYNFWIQVRKELNNF